MSESTVPVVSESSPISSPTPEPEQLAAASEPVVETESEEPAPITGVDLSLAEIARLATEANLRAQAREDEQAEEQAEEPTPEQAADAKTHAAALSRLADKAEAAFASAERSLTYGRVKAGLCCHQLFEYRAAHGLGDRNTGEKLLFNRLALYASSSRDADPSRLALAHHTVALLWEGEMDLRKSTQPWTSLSWGKMEKLVQMVERLPDTEEYRVKEWITLEAARAVFQAACAVDVSRIGVDRVGQLVLALVSPTKFAEQQAKAEAKAAEEPAEPAVPRNLLGDDDGSTASTASLVDAKDLPDMFAALLSRDDAAKVLCAALRQVRWTETLAGAILDGLADNRKDPEAAEQAMAFLAAGLAEYVGEGYEAPSRNGQPA